MTNRTDIEHAAATPGLARPQRNQSSTRKLMLALLALAVAGLLIGYQVLSRRPQSISRPFAPAVEMLTSIADQLASSERLFDGVQWSASEDGQRVVVSGTVRSQADLEKIKALFASGKPQVPVDYSLRVGR